MITHVGLAILLLIPILALVPTQDIRGRITSESDEGLEGVQVWTAQSMGTGKPTKTDRDGNFLLAEPVRIMRFTFKGYRPATIALLRPPQGISLKLVRDPHALWNVPNCVAKTNFNWGAMGFTVPREGKVRVTDGGDSINATITVQKHKMRFGMGGNWSSGLPTTYFFDDLSKKEIKEREVRSREDYPVAEYSGFHIDGSQFRWIGAFGSTIGYERVPSSISSVFDQILDSMCWDPSFFQGQ